MNNNILGAILRIDACFYPELQRIQEPDEMLDVYRAKTYLRGMTNRAERYLPAARGQTLLNRIVHWYNHFIRNFADRELMLSPLPTLVSQQRLSHNRQFDSLWGVLNLFSSFDKRTIEAAFLVLAEQFEQLLEEFNVLGFPSILEGLLIISMLIGTLDSVSSISGRPNSAGGSGSLSSVYLYLIRLLQTMFLQQPLRYSGAAEFYHDLGVYLTNKYPDGFDRIYTQLRSSYMYVQNIEYKKELLYINETNFLTNATPFRIDRLFQQHFVSRSVQRPRDPICAFYAIINYILNVFVEVAILTGETTIETGLLHMHNAVYQNEAIASLEESLESEQIEQENMHVPPRITIIEDLQNSRNGIQDRQAAEKLIECAEEPQDGQREPGTVNATEAGLLFGYTGDNFAGYLHAQLERRQQLFARLQATLHLADKFIQQYLDQPARLSGLRSQLGEIFRQTVGQVEDVHAARLDPSELIEFLTGNLSEIEISDFTPVTDIELNHVGTISPVNAIMRVLSALQARRLAISRSDTTVQVSQLEQVNRGMVVTRVDDGASGVENDGIMSDNVPHGPGGTVAHLIAEFEQLQTELRVKQLSLQLSRTDVIVISAKAVVEALAFQRRCSRLFGRIGIAPATTPSQFVRHSLQVAQSTKTRFSTYFEDLPPCACGAMRGVVAKLVRVIAEMLLCGVEFTIEDTADAIRDGQSLIQIPIRFANMDIITARFADIEPGQCYAYFGIGAFVEIHTPLVEGWVGGDAGMEEDDGTVFVV